MFDEKRIRKILKMHGASDEEIENFIKDLQEYVEDKLEEFDETNDDDFVVD